KHIEGKDKAGRRAKRVYVPVALDDRLREAAGGVVATAGRGATMPELAGHPSQFGREPVSVGHATSVFKAEMKEMMDESSYKGTNRALDEREAAGRGLHFRPTIISLGKLNYCISGTDPVTVTDSEDTVLQAFLVSPSMDHETLADTAGFAH